MELVDIERKRVPIPSSRYKYPWQRMKIGDSFFVKGKTAQQFGGHIAHAGKHYHMTFTTRTVNGGLRVWRVK